VDNETFKRICARAAAEEDPNVLELLKNRMRVLLSLEGSEKTPDSNPDEVKKVN
jgi:hypothetical protein